MKKLNFGCGKDIKKGWINVDGQKANGIDKSFDFDKFDYPFSDNFFDYILVNNVLEHMSNPQRVMKELWRISKKGALIEIIVPYYNSYWAFGDPTHKIFFNEQTIKETLGDISHIHKKQNERFEIINICRKPQKHLRFLPKKFLIILSRFLNNVIVELNVKVKVLK